MHFLKELLTISEDVSYKDRMNFKLFQMNHFVIGLMNKTQIYLKYKKFKIEFEDANQGLDTGDDFRFIRMLGRQ